MDSERLRMLADAPGPFVSLHIDDTRDTPDADKQVAARWATVRQRLEGSDTAAQVIGDIEDALLRRPAGYGMHGRVVIAGGQGVLINVLVETAPPVTVLRVSDYPYVLPLLGHGTFRPPYVFAGVDHLGAEITWHQNGAVGRETVDGGGHPVHKPVTAGWHGYADRQRSTEEAVRMNVRAAAERITEAVDRTGAGIVFVSGEVRSRSDVVAALPERIAERVVPLAAGAQGGRLSEADVEALISAEFERRRIEAAHTALARLDTEHGRHSGLAAHGLPSVCAALRDGAVDTLLLGDLGDATVVTGQDRSQIAPDADALSELGEAPCRVVRVDEALPFAAIATDAEVVCLDGDAAISDGVAALLRYPAP